MIYALVALAILATIIISIGRMFSDDNRENNDF